MLYTRDLQLIVILGGLSDTFISTQQGNKKRVQYSKFFYLVKTGI